jgi:hypothetical protein
MNEPLTTLCEQYCHAARTGDPRAKELGEQLATAEQAERDRRQAERDAAQAAAKIEGVGLLHRMAGALAAYNEALNALRALDEKLRRQGAKLPLKVPYPGVPNLESQLFFVESILKENV